MLKTKGSRAKGSRAKGLTIEQIATYNRDGFLTPIPVLETEEAARYLHCYEEFVTAWGRPIKRAENLHLVFPWAHELACNPRVLAAVGDLLEAPPVVWGSLAFCKYPRSMGFVPWHQDSVYTDFLAGAPSLTAWIALTQSHPENGCMRASPGTHTGRIDHGTHLSVHNLLKQQHAVDGHEHDEAAINLVLQPGEMSLHHLDLVHGSNPNISDERRLGFIVRYTPAPDPNGKYPQVRLDQSPAGLVDANARPPERSLDETVDAYRLLKNEPK